MTTAAEKKLRWELKRVPDLSKWRASTGTPEKHKFSGVGAGVVGKTWMNWVEEWMGGKALENKSPDNIYSQGIHEYLEDILTSMGLRMEVELMAAYI